MVDGVKIQKTGLTTIIIIALSYIVFSLLNYSHINEDAFIYFRFVENLANGYGYVFNPGERIEGCSSVTWLFLLTFFRILEFNILTTSKILGIIFGSISLFFIFQITKHFTVKMPWVILPSLLTVFSLPFCMWNQMGLETSLYTMVFLAVVLICLNNDFFPYWPLIALILTLTRPEGLFLLLGLIPALYFQKEKKVLLSILLFSVLCMIVFLTRFIYFHDLLPSPFYIKTFEGKYIAGFKYIHSFFMNHYIYYFCAPLLFILPQKFNWRKERIIVFGFIVVYLVWIILGGSEPKPFYRYIVAVIPLLYIYLITGIEQAIGEFTPIKKVLMGIYITAFCIVTLFFASDSWLGESIKNPIVENMQYFINNPSRYLTFCSKRLQNPKEFNYVGADKSRQLLKGEFIRLSYPSGTTLLYDQMGRVPYQAGINYYFIDSFGLMDKKINRYCYREKEQGIPLEFFERFISSLIKNFFPQTEFIDSRTEAINYIFRQRKPDVIMISAPLRLNKKHLPFWLIKDDRLNLLYKRKYFIGDTVVFEKKSFTRRQLNIPEGLLISDKQVANILKDQIDDAISKNNYVLTPIGNDSAGISNDEDNFPHVSNSDQADTKGNGIGNACETTSSENHWLEAENAYTIVSLFRVGYDEHASKGKFIHSLNGTGDTYFPSRDMATYTVNISHAGAYMLWGRIKASDKSDNSFFVQIDNGRDNLWEMDTYNYWNWDPVNDRNGNDPVIFILNAGKHIIKVKLREDGTKLDKLLLTNNTDCVPTGK